MSRDVSKDSIEKANDEITREIHAHKTNAHSDVMLPPSKDFKLTEQGGLVVTLVFVTLYTHRLCRLTLENAETYIDLIRKHKHLSNILQSGNDVLKDVATHVKRELKIHRLPMHFFDKNGQPIHHVDNMMLYATQE